MVASHKGFEADPDLCPAGCFVTLDQLLHLLDLSSPSLKRVIVNPGCNKTCDGPGAREALSQGGVCWY
jgi:hypothetical protein